jgi:hypothetical protein
MPNIPSYLFENIILNYYENKNNISAYIDCNMNDFWEYLSSQIFLDFNDPKGFQGNINTLNSENKSKISIKSIESYHKSVEAINFETQEYNQEKAINKWREIFGDDFPSYSKI